MRRVSDHARLTRPGRVFGQLADRPRGVRSRGCWRRATPGDRRTASWPPRCARRGSRAMARSAPASGLQADRRPRSAARLAPSDAPAMPTLPARTSGRDNRYDTLARTSALHAPSDFRIAGIRHRPADRSQAPVMFASASRWPPLSQSSFGRPSIGTSTTAGAGRCDGSKTNALIVRPSSARNVTPRPAANAGDAIRQISRIADPKGPRRTVPSRAALHCHPARTSRNSRTLCARPTNSAWLMSAWPIDTSSRCGRRRNSTRLSRSRSWPALTPRPRAVRERRGARIRGKRLACLRRRRAQTRARTVPCTARRGRRPYPPPTGSALPPDRRTG